MNLIASIIIVIFLDKQPNLLKAEKLFDDASSEHK